MIAPQELVGRPEGRSRTLVYQAAVAFVDLTKSSGSKLTPKRRGPRPNPHLSAKEKQILSMVAAGLTKPYMAKLLRCNEGNISNTLHRAYGKLHVMSAAAAVFEALLRNEITVNGILQYKSYAEEAVSAEQSKRQTPKKRHKEQLSSMHTEVYDLKEVVDTWLSRGYGRVGAC